MEQSSKRDAFALELVTGEMDGGDKFPSRKRRVQEDRAALLRNTALSGSAEGYMEVCWEAKDARSTRIASVEAQLLVKMFSLVSLGSWRPHSGLPNFSFPIREETVKLKKSD